MSGPQEDGKLRPLKDVKTGFNLLFIVAHAYAFSMKVFIHTGMGRRAFGLASLLVLLLIPVHAGFWTDADCAPLMGFWYAYLAACVVHGLQRGRRRRQGRANEVHTYYDGTPLLSYALPWVSESTLKQIGEPMLLLFLAIPIGAWSGPLASFIVLGAICLGLTYALEADSIQQVDDDLHDQMHEARWRSERFGQD